MKFKTIFGIALFSALCALVATAQPYNPNAPKSPLSVKASEQCLSQEQCAAVCKPTSDMQEPPPPVEDDTIEVQPDEPQMPQPPKMPKYPKPAVPQMLRLDTGPDEAQVCLTNAQCLVKCQ